MGSSVILIDFQLDAMANAQIEDVLGQASAVSANLKDQRGILGNVGSKLENVATRFPVVTGLLNAIRRRKNRVGQNIVTSKCIS